MEDVIGCGLDDDASLMLTKLGHRFLATAMKPQIIHKIVFKMDHGYIHHLKL